MKSLELYSITLEAECLENVAKTRSNENLKGQPEGPLLVFLKFINLKIPAPAEIARFKALEYQTYWVTTINKIDFLSSQAIIH